MNYKPIRHKFLQKFTKHCREIHFTDGVDSIIQENSFIDPIEMDFFENNPLTTRWNYNGHTNINVDFMQCNWNQTLITKINFLVRQLHRCFNVQESLVNDFNTLTTTLTSITVLESMPCFSYIPQHPSTSHLQPVGVIMNKFVVIMDSTDISNRIYLGTRENPKLAYIFIGGLN